MVNRKALGVLVLVLSSPAVCFGQLTGDYANWPTELRAAQAAWAEVDAPAHLKDTINEQIDNLLNLLDLGESAGDLGIDDAIVGGEARQLLDLLFQASAGPFSLGLSGYDVVSQLDEAARAIEDRAETARLLSQAGYLPEIPVLKLFNPLSPLNGHCSVRVSVVHTNPDSRNRFASLNIFAIAAPSGGTFSRTIEAFRVVQDSSSYDPMVPFSGTPVVKESKTLTSTALPRHDLTVEADFGTAVELTISRQVWKDVRLNGPVPSNNTWEIRIQVKYQAPNGTSCSAGKHVTIDDQEVSLVSAYTAGTDGY